MKYIEQTVYDIKTGKWITEMVEYVENVGHTEPQKTIEEEVTELKDQIKSLNNANIELLSNNLDLDFRLLELEFKR